MGDFTAATLDQSYANFPNPFAAGREQTTFVYFLSEPAQVSLDLWSSRGAHVLTLLDGASRGAGLHQSDQWDGRNGRGSLVINDVFIAEIRVDYDAGGSSRLRRKVAVIR